MPEPGVGTDPWDVPDAGYFADSGTGILDQIFDFATSTFRTGVEYINSDRAYELERLRVTTAYDDNTQPGATAYGVDGSTVQTLLLLGLAGVAVFALIKAVR